MITLMAAAVVAASGNPTQPQHAACAVTKEFVGTAPSDIVQQKFEARYDQPLERVDCRDNGLCYQKWGKNCSQAKE